MAQTRPFAGTLAGRPEESESPWTYTLVKADDGWRILSIFGQDPGVGVRWR